MTKETWKSLKSIAIVIAVAGATWLVERRGWFDSLEGAAFDFQHRLAISNLPELSENIVVVDIDDDSYERCFKNSSPLNPQSVMELVKNVSGSQDKSGNASSKPVVVGVDILTESQEYASYLNDKKVEAPVIWAVDTLKKTHENEIVYEPRFVLGRKVAGEVPNAGMGELRWGPPVYPQEGDSHVRRYPRSFVFSRPTSGEVLSDSYRVRTWARAVSETYRKEKKNGEQQLEREPEMVFLTHRKRAGWIPASAFLKGCSPESHEHSATARKETGLGEQISKDAVKDKIVLIGGTFGGKDEHLSAVDQISGIALNAAAVKAELSNDFVREVPRWLFFIGDIALGFILLLWDHAYPSKTVRGKFTKVGAVAFILFCISWKMMDIGLIWLSWSGFLLGMLIVLMVELNVENPKMNEHEDKHESTPES